MNSYTLATDAWDACKTTATSVLSITYVPPIGLMTKNTEGTHTYIK